MSYIYWNTNNYKKFDPEMETYKRIKRINITIIKLLKKYKYTQSSFYTVPK